MPSRAFVPAPLVEAEPRVYKSFRGRELRGICFGLAGAAVSLWFVGVSHFAGYVITFLAALPGFAYGYYQPQGKPVEYWLRVMLHFYLTPQVLAACPQGWKERARRLAAEVTAVRRAAVYLALKRLRQGKGLKHRG